MSLWFRNLASAHAQAGAAARARALESDARRTAAAPAAAPAAAVNAETQTDVEAAAVADVEAPADGTPPPTNAAGARQRRQQRRRAAVRRAAVSTLLLSARFTLTFYTLLSLYRSSVVIGSIFLIANTSGLPGGSTWRNKGPPERTEDLWWILAFAMQQAACWLLSSWRRREVARQRARGRSHDEVELSICFLQLHALVGMVGGLALFVAGLLLAAQPMTEHHHPVQRVWLEVCTGLVGVSFLLPFVVYYACVLLFPCVLALLASVVATEAGNAAVGAGASSSARGLSAEALAALPTSTYAARRGGGAEGDADGDAAAAAASPGAAGGKEGGGGEGDDDVDGAEDDTTCCICFGEYEDGEMLRPLHCGHTFHRKCIDSWLRLQSKCPVCRQPALGSSDLRGSGSRAAAAAAAEDATEPPAAGSDAESAAPSSAPATDLEAAADRLGPHAAASLAAGQAAMRAVAILEATDDDDPDDDAIRVAAAAVLEEAAPQAEDADAEVELVALNA